MGRKIVSGFKSEQSVNYKDSKAPQTLAYLFGEHMIKNIIDNEELDEMIYSSNDWTTLQWHDKFNDFLLYILANKGSKELESMDFSGSRYITDAGIMWIARSIKESFPKLKKILLDNCPNITEIGLSALLKHVPPQVSVRMCNTSVSSIPNWLTTESSDYDFNGSKSDFRYDFNGTESAVDVSSELKNVTAGVLIWSEPEVSFQLSTLLVDKRLDPIESSGLSYASNWKLKHQETEVTVNLFEVHNVEIPPYDILPQRPEQVVIMVSDDQDRAKKHVVETVAHFVSKDQRICSGIQGATTSAKSAVKEIADLPPILPIKRPKFIPKLAPARFQQLKKKAPPPMKMTNISKKKGTKSSPVLMQTKKGADLNVMDAFQEAADELEDTANQYDDFFASEQQQEQEMELELDDRDLESVKHFQTKNADVRNMEIQDGWVIPFNTSRSSSYDLRNTFNIINTTFSCFVKTTNLSSINYGVKLKLFKSKSDLCRINLNTFKITLDGKETQATKPRVNDIYDLTVSFRGHGDEYQKGQFKENAKAMLTIIVNSETIYSCVLKFTGQVYLSLFSEPTNDSEICAVSYFVNGESTAGAKGIKTDELDLGVEFIVACTGDKASATASSLKALNFSTELQPYIDKLNLVSKNIGNRKGAIPSFQEQQLLGRTLNQTDNMKWFIESSISRFNVEVIDSKTFKNSSIETLLTSNIVKQAKIFPLYSASKVTAINDVITTSKILTLNDLKFFWKRRQLNTCLKEMHNRGELVYLSNDEIIFPDVGWLVHLLQTIVLLPRHKSSGTVQGLHVDSAVWSQEELTNALEKEFSLTDANQRNLIIKALCNIGALMRLPCIRFKSSDPLFVYTNPFNSDHTDLDLKMFNEARNDENQLLEASRKYSSVCCPLGGLFPALVSQICRLGRLQMVTFGSLVLHIGAVEVMVTLEKDCIHIAVYCRLPTLSADLDKAAKAINQRSSQLTYIWSVAHLITDVMDLLIIKAGIVANVSTSSPLLEPINHSICYRHEWSTSAENAGKHRTVCTLCLNCASPQASLCPYTGIMGPVTYSCLCAAETGACVHCGICPSCADFFWNTHCKLDPNCLVSFRSSANHPSDVLGNAIITVDPDEPLNVALKPEISMETCGTTNLSLQLYHVNSGASVVILPQKPKVLTNFRQTVSANLPANVYRVRLSIPDVSQTSNRAVASPNSVHEDLAICNYEYRLINYMHINQALGILTYDPIALPSSSPVGIFIGLRPVTQTNNSFSVRILSPGKKGCIAIGYVPKQYPRDCQPGWTSESIAIHADDGGIFVGNGAATKHVAAFRNSGAIVTVRLVYGDRVKFEVLVNGKEVVKGITCPFSAETEVYPAIGMHSTEEQVQLVDRKVWAKPTEEEEESIDNMLGDPNSAYIGKKKLLITPGKIMRFAKVSTKSLLHSFLQIRSLESNYKIKIDKICPGKFGIAPIQHEKLKSEAVSATCWNFDVSGDQTCTFSVSVPGKDVTLNVNTPCLKVTITFPDGFSIEEEILFAMETKRESMDGNHAWLIMNDGEAQTPKDSYFVEVETEKDTDYSFWIPKGQYIPRITEQITNLSQTTIAMPNYVKPLFTRNFRPGNILMLHDVATKNLTPKMVHSVDQDKCELKLAGHPTSLPFSSPLLRSITQRFVPKGFKNMLHTFPSPGLIHPPEDGKPTDQLPFIYRGSRCQELTSFLIAGIEAQITSVVTNLATLTVPLPVRIFLPQWTHKMILLRHHSFLSITRPEMLMAHSLCVPEKPNSQYKEDMHFVDEPGVLVPELQEEQVFANTISHDVYLTMVRMKISLKHFTQMFQPSSNFTHEEIEYFVTLMIRKLASYCHLHYTAVRQSLSLMQGVKSPNSNQLSEVNNQFVCGSHAVNTGFKMEKDEDATALRYAAFLNTFTLSTDTMVALPDTLLKHFTNLQILTVANSIKLEQLPDLSSLKNLRELTVTNLPHLLSLPASMRHLTNLRTVTLTKTGIQSLPDIPINSSKLGNILFNVVPLLQYPTSWTKYDHLKELVLKHVALCDLPPEFANLSTLETLVIRGVSWLDETVPLLPTMSATTASAMLESIFPVLDSPCKVQVADSIEQENLFAHVMQEKQLEELRSLPTAVAACARLTVDVPRLGLGMDRKATDSTTAFGGFPPCIFRLTSLRSLDITFQMVRFLPKAIEQLANLNLLRLSHNPLMEDIVPEVGKLQQLKHFHLRRCPSLKTPPNEVVSRGSDAIISYFKFLSSDQVECRRTKLMLVGLGGVGKTSILRSLLSPNNKTSSIDDEAITDGIAIDKWTVPCDDGNSIEFSTWDFAGQTTYYNTHQFFLSKRAVYLLLWTVRLGHEHAGLDFWLSSIMCHAPNAPVFIVGTHCDKVERYTIPQEQLMKKYPQIVGFHFVSCLRGDGIADLKDSIIKTTMELPYIGENLPGTIFQLEKDLVAMRSKESVLKWEEVTKIATKCGLFKDKDVKDAITFLHDLGTVQFFDRELLRDFVVINPQWIADVMACVVSVKTSPIVDGLFLHADMPKVWGEVAGKVELNWLLQLTEEFDLTFRHAAKNANIVPCLLPDKEPEIILPPFDPDNEVLESRVEYQFSYLPGGLFNRIQVRLFDLTECKEIWKRGFVFVKNDHTVLVKQERETLQVLARGVRPTNVVFMVHEVLETLIQESFRGVSYNMNIPCPDCMEAKITNEYSTLDVEVIRKAKLKNALFLQCRPHFHAPLIGYLLTLIPSNTEEDFIYQLDHSLLQLSTLNSNISIHIAISYCPEDFNEKSLVKVERLFLILTEMKLRFKDLTKLDPKQYPGILMECGLLLVLGSINYANSKAYADIFTSYVLSMRKPYQVVCVGGNKGWLKETKLGMTLGSPIYIDMTENKKEVIAHKEIELKTHIEKHFKNQAEANKFDCFLSYCWSNSHSAVAKGAKKIDGGLGWQEGDPRVLADLIRANGFTCWIDTENAQGNLMDDIHRGLKSSKLFICCISNEYGTSENCKMEMDFALMALNLPVIFVVVGTGNLWRRERVGMLMLKHLSKPEINLQTPNSVEKDKLLTIIKELLKDVKVNKSAPTSSGSTQNQVEHKLAESYQEGAELIQRKFLREISVIAARISDRKPYPRIIVLDFIDKNWANEETQLEDKDWKDLEFCIRIFCEYEHGWHLSGDPISLPSDIISKNPALLSSSVLYLHKVYAILECSRISLNCFHGPAGMRFREYIAKTASHQMSQPNNSLKEHYESLLACTIHDENSVRGDLTRGLLGSGKQVWLCQEHFQSNKGRIKALPDSDSRQLGGSQAVLEGDILMRDALFAGSETGASELAREKEAHAARFAESMRVHQAYLDKSGEKVVSALFKKNLRERPTLNRHNTVVNIARNEVTSSEAASTRVLRPKTGRMPQPPSESKPPTPTPRSRGTPKPSTDRRKSENPPPNVQAAQSKACSIQ